MCINICVKNFILYVLIVCALIGDHFVKFASACVVREYDCFECARQKAASNGTPLRPMTKLAASQLCQHQYNSAMLSEEKMLVEPVFSRCREVMQAAGAGNNLVWLDFVHRKEKDKWIVPSRYNRPLKLDDSSQISVTSNIIGSPQEKFRASCGVLDVKAKSLSIADCENRANISFVICHSTFKRCIEVERQSPTSKCFVKNHPKTKINCKLRQDATAEDNYFFRPCNISMKDQKFRCLPDDKICHDRRIIQVRPKRWLAQIYTGCLAVSVVSFLIAGVGYIGSACRVFSEVTLARGVSDGVNAKDILTTMERLKDYKRRQTNQIF